MTAEQLANETAQYIEAATGLGVYACILSAITRAVQQERQAAANRSLDFVINYGAGPTWSAHDLYHFVINPKAQLSPPVAAPPPPPA